MKMNDAFVKQLKDQYPQGTRIVLDFMSDDMKPIASGTKGTVDIVDDMGTLHCKFDNGRYFGICPEVDIFHKIPQQEENQSIGMSM